MSQFLDEGLSIGVFWDHAPRQHGRNQKNPGNRGKGNGVNVSNGSSKSARKNTASVSAEPTTNSTINSVSWARLMTCSANAAARNFTVGPPTLPRTPRHGKVWPRLCCELGYVGIGMLWGKIIQRRVRRVISSNPPPPLASH